MKIARLVSKLALSFLALTLQKLSSSSFLSLHNISQDVSHLTMLLALALFIVTILLGSSNSNSKPSSSSFEFDHLSFLAPYILSHDLGEATSNNTGNVSCKVSYSLEVARVVHADIEVDVCSYGNKDGFNINEGSCSDVDTDSFHGYDGYDEDNDDDCNEEDYGFDSDEEEEDEDLTRRAEEFIAENIRKWKEEMLIDYKMDNMLYLAAEEWQFSV